MNGVTNINCITTIKEGILLVKNNLKSLLIYVSISIISVIVFFLFNIVQVKWASEEAAM